MPTVDSESNTVRHELWTAEEFPDWLEPGKHADRIDGERFIHSPVNLRQLGSPWRNFINPPLPGTPVGDVEIGGVLRRMRQLDLQLAAWP
jgi:hypothetical protein